MTAATMEPSVPAAGAAGLGTPGEGSGASLPASRAPAERFAPGQLMAGGRYRIVGLLGRGGMGEVYRADDLRLGQPLALKFLPEKWSRDAAALSRLLDEVRVARHVSHPNVCRVYDVVETAATAATGGSAGAPPAAFITMEFVDGEDLASLLRRIGRLPPGKAVQIARELCAGLAAAHERGVLHRDLKPANIMIDGRGHARIMDFGLAGLGVDAKAGFRAGTPAYMAPEHLAEGNVSVQSDLYALGLVLYELFTGEAVFAGQTLAEIRHLHHSGHTPRASGVAPDIDPAVERVISWCLESNPVERPASASAVAASLPGHDVIAAVLAAGETPSPELLAATREERVLGPAGGAVWLCVALGLLAVVALVNNARAVFRLTPMDKPPAVLTERARDMVKGLGFDADPLDWRTGFQNEIGYLVHEVEEGATARVWESLPRARPPVITFWYRQGPRYIEPELAQEQVTFEAPVMRDPGSASVRLDTIGRLVEFRGIPAQGAAVARVTSEVIPGQAVVTDWSPLFTAAGLDASDFAAAEPRGLAPIAGDERVAWEVGARAASRAGLPPEMRIEAGAQRGRPVYFLVTGPWFAPDALPDPAGERVSAVAELIAMIVLGIPVLALPLVGAIVMARRNLRAGRGDRRGAARVAAFVFGAEMLWWMLWTDHAQPADDLERAMIATGAAMFNAAIVWLGYIAVEPAVRRRWPRMLISWMRVLAGRWPDAVVGRDLIAGVATGGAWMVLVQSADVAAEWRSGRRLLPRLTDASLFDPWRAAGALCDSAAGGVIVAMASLVLLLLLRGRDRMGWVQMVLFWVVTALATLFYWALLIPVLGLVDLEYGGLEHGAVAAVTALGTFLVLWRLGLLSAVVGGATALVLIAFPITLDLRAWYGASAAVVLGALTLVAVAGFWNVAASRARTV